MRRRRLVAAAIALLIIGAAWWAWRASTQVAPTFTPDIAAADAARESGTDRQAIGTPHVRLTAKLPVVEPSGPDLSVSVPAAQPPVSSDMRVRTAAAAPVAGRRSCGERQARGRETTRRRPRAASLVQVLSTRNITGR